MISSLIYTFDKSGEVYEATCNFIKEHEGLKLEMEDYLSVYNSLVDLVPQDMQTFWSGNTFPLQESFEELQISFVLSSQGLYKQSLTSLRNVLELTLLSIYMNIGDEGHLDIKSWLSSQNETPRIPELWSKISRHHNFKEINQVYDLKTRLLQLNELHDFVHTKGYKYSNKMGIKFKSNFQTFEEETFIRWYETMKEVVRVSVILHLVKYPLGIIEYDYSRKFGIDIPMLGGLQPHHTSVVRSIIEPDVVSYIESIAKKDSHVNEIMEWLDTLDDMSEEEIEEQIIKREMEEIEYFGLNIWLGNFDRLYSETIPDSKWRERREILIDYAKRNNFFEHESIRVIQKIKEYKEEGYSLAQVKKIIGTSYGDLEDRFENPEGHIANFRQVINRT
ncbi:hypothetical protein ACQ4XT_00255 [Halobacillus faecis]